MLTLNSESYTFPGTHLPISIEKMVQIVCEEVNKTDLMVYGQFTKKRFICSRENISTNKRDIEPKTARQIIMTLLNFNFKMSTTKAGQYFDLDHVTVLNAKKRVAEGIIWDSNYRDMFMRIITRMGYDNKKLEDLCEFLKIYDAKQVNKIVSHIDIYQRKPA